MTVKEFLQLLENDDGTAQVKFNDEHGYEDVCDAIEAWNRCAIFTIHLQERKRDGMRQQELKILFIILIIALWREITA